MLQITDWMLQYERGRDYVFGQAQSTVMKMTKGKYPAPLEIIKVRSCLLVTLRRLSS